MDETVCLCHPFGICRAYERLFRREKVQPLDISGFQRIAVAPFSTEKDSAGMERRFPLDLSTQLSLVKKDKEWIYDQSDTLNPVGTALAAQNLTPTGYLSRSCSRGKGRSGGKCGYNYRWPYQESED